MLSKSHNLIYLVYQGNSAYVKVTNIQPEDVELNLETDQWVWLSQPPGFQIIRRTYKIGEMRNHTHVDRSGVIGVYNRNRLKHLSDMTQDSITATKTDRQF